MISKLKCILLDDELPGLTYLKMLCEQVPEIEVVKSFNDPTIFLEEINQLDFDAIITDIEMPGINGLSLAQLITDKAVIFTTAYKEFAIEAFEIDAIDYIQKPIKRERLQKAIHKALRFTEAKPKNNYITVNSNKGKVLLHFEAIQYIKTSELDSRDKLVYLSGDSNPIILKNISLDKLLHDLPKKDFCRINKSEIISLKTIHYFSHDEITTTLLGEQGKPIVLTLGVAFKSDFLTKV